MPDKCSSDARSYNMSRIHSGNTKPEESVRKYLFSRGLRYRKNDKRYPGKPDLIFPKFKTVLFINGCFWHSHEGCKYFVIPKSNIDFWTAKLQRNSKRDKENIKNLEEMGWKVLVVWECELRKGLFEKTMQDLYEKIYMNGLSVKEKR